MATEQSQRDSLEGEEGAFDSKKTSEEQALAEAKATDEAKMQFMLAALLTATLSAVAHAAVGGVVVPGEGSAHCANDGGSFVGLVSDKSFTQRCKLGVNECWTMVDSKELMASFDHAGGGMFGVIYLHCMRLYPRHNGP